MALRSFFSGLLTAGAVTTLFLGAVPRLIGTTNTLGPLFRIVDSFAPYFLLFSLIFAFILGMLSARKIAALSGAIAILAGAQLFIQHRSLSEPFLSDAPPLMRVVFLNIERRNTQNTAKIVEVTENLDADVIVFAEANVFSNDNIELPNGYAPLTTCLPESCEVLMLTRRNAIRAWQLSLNENWPPRYAVAEFQLTDQASIFIAGVHLAKPWLSGISESEQAQAAAQLDWFEGPAVILGDFNAAPWSYTQRRLMTLSSAKTNRRPSATWPSQLGSFGLPIDQVLVKNGARLVGLQTFGDDLGSNHLGLIADIALEQEKARQVGGLSENLIIPF